MHYRWPILASAGIVALANEFLNNQPSALVQRLTGKASECTSEDSDKCLNLTVFHFNALFTVANFVSALGAISAGYFADRLGTSKLTYIAASFAPLGQILVASSPYVVRNWQYAIIIFGQLLLGLSDGVLITLAHHAKSSWFSSNELGMSFAVHTVMAGIGSSLVFLLYGAILPVLGLTGCLWTGLGVALLASTATICMGYLNSLQPVTQQSWHSDIFAGSFFEEAKLVLRFLKRQPASLWILVVSAFFFKGTVFAFVANAPNMFAERYSLTESRASYIAGVVYYVQIIAPLFGWLNDRYGYRDLWLLGAGSTLVVGLFSAYAECLPAGVYASLIGLGDAAYGIASTSCVSIIAGDGASGVAFGLLKFLDSLGNSVMTGVAGGLLLNSMVNERLMWIRFLALLTATSLITLGLLLALFVYNQLTGRTLSFSQLKRNLSRHTDRDTSTVSKLSTSSLQLQNPLRNSFPEVNYQSFRNNLINNEEELKLT